MKIILNNLSCYTLIMIKCCVTDVEIGTTCKYISTMYF